MGPSSNPLSSPASVTDTPRIGTVVAGKWRLERVLGSGGASIVYEASHHNGHVVAIKMMHPHLLKDADLVARFTREGHVANRVGHPGVVRTLDDGVTDDGLPFLVLELLEGESLGRYLARSAALPEDVAVKILDQVLDALGAAHACGLVHRDIKPENIFLMRDGSVKILDFGIAGMSEPMRRGETSFGTVMGTPAFMPPEQARGRWDEVKAQSDLWAVGATLFTMLAGRYLHGEVGTTMEELLAAAQPVPPIRTLAPAIRPALATVLDRALAFAPSDRFVSASDMQAALRETMQDHPSEPPAEWVAVRPDRRTLGLALGIGGAIVLCAAGIAGSCLARDRVANTVEFLPAPPSATALREPSSAPAAFNTASPMVMQLSAEVSPMPQPTATDVARLPVVAPREPAPRGAALPRSRAPADPMQSRF